MSLTFPAAFVFENAADTAVITASSSLTLTPPSRLQDAHIGRKWRTETDTAALTIALAAGATIDSIGLFGLSGPTSAGVEAIGGAVTRVRASLADTSAVDGAVYDSGSAAGRVSAYYGNLVTLMPTSGLARYIRIDLTVAGAAYIEAGFLVIGLKTQVGINFTFGAQDTPVDPSIKTKSRSGATFIDGRSKYRSWDFNFEWLSEDERFGFVEDIDRLCGASQNVMVVRRCNSDALGRDTLCGLITDAAPVIARDGFIDAANAYSKAYKIEQRL